MPIRFGAFDYLLKPFDKDDMLLVINKGLKKRRNKENLKLETGIIVKQNNGSRKSD